MKEADLYRVDVDFKILSDKIWEIASNAETDKKLLPKIYAAGKGDKASSPQWLARMVKSVLNGFWTSSEDLAKQMDLNIKDHQNYVELYQYLRDNKI